MAMYENDTNHKIGASRFKCCMMLCEVRDKKEGHTFDTHRFNPDSGEYDPITLRAGKYWCGIKQKRKENLVDNRNAL